MRLDVADGPQVHLDAADRGSATVEFALALPAFVVVLALALSALTWSVDSAAAQRAASEAARAAVVRSDSAAIGVARAIMPSGQATVVRAADLVTVCVTARRDPWPVVRRCASAWDHR